MNDITEHKAQARPKYLTLCILLMVPLTGMGIDLYAPSLPWIVSALHTTPELVKLTIAMYLFGYAFGPLFAGTFSDTVGRRPTLIIGMVIYIAACVSTIVMPSIETMLAMRFLQGIGASFLAVCYRAMVTDSYDRGKDMQKMGAQVAPAWSLGPVIAPFIGGYLQHYFNWQANFIFYIAYAVAMLGLAFVMPETNINKNKWAPKKLFKQYREIFSHRIFWGCVICMGAVYGMIVLFNVIGPFLIQDVLHYSAVDFGYIALIMGGGFLMGNLLNRYFVTRYSVKQLIQFGLFVSLAGFIVFLVLGYLYPVNLYAYFIPLFVSLMFSSFIFPNAMSTVLGLFPKMAGAASAMVGLTFSSITALATVMASYLPSANQIPAAYAYIGITVVCAIFFYALMYRHLCKKS